MADQMAGKMVVLLVVRLAASKADQMVFPLVDHWAA
jgi:hypothetical protein